VAYQYNFDVAARYFEEIFQYLKKKKRKAWGKHIECSDLLV